MKKIDVIAGEDAGRLPLYKKTVRAYARTVLQECNVLQYTVNIVFIGDRFMEQLNQSYRKRSGTTDVLSFTLSEPAAPVLEGEIYLSLDQAARQAADAGVPLDREVVMLITHGLLHLSGRIHDTEQDFKSMVDDTDRLMRAHYPAEEQPS